MNQPVIYSTVAQEGAAVEFRHISQSSISSPLASDSAPRKKPHSKYKWTPFFCTLVHILLVALHVALLVICVHHYEHSITADVTRFTTNWAPLVVNVVSQVVATVSIPCRLLTMTISLLPICYEALSRFTRTHHAEASLTQRSPNTANPYLHP